MLDDTVCAEAERLRQDHNEIEALRRKLEADFKASETGKQFAQTSLADPRQKSAGDPRRTHFLKEWNDTLGYLRLVQSRLADPANRPKWVPADVAPGIHTDQFLHAYYYTKVREGQLYPVEKRHLANRSNPEAALREALAWWRATTHAPSSEDTVFRDWAPVHRELLTPERLARMTEAEFVRVLRRVHSTNNYASRRRPEEIFDAEELATDPANERKMDLYCEQLYDERNLLNWPPPRLLAYLLFGGPVAEVPSRLYECLHPPYKIAGLDVSSLGELIGCGLPNDYPPRNDRTNKALRALGWDVHVRSPNRESPA